MPESLIRVVAAIVEREERVLIALRPPKKRHGGMWEFPGGKVEPGETDLDALRRELSEELGLDVVSALPPVASIQDPGSPFLIVFVPVRTHGEPNCREHTAIRWAGWRELETLNLAPTDHRFVVTRMLHYDRDNRRL
jgi:8-oxo-dGTP diphosphatase